MTQTNPAQPNENSSSSGITPRRSIIWCGCQAFARIITTLMFDLKVYGLHHIPTHGGALLVANHESYLDPVVVAVRVRRPVSFLARSGLFDNPAFGWLIRSLHAFPVRQGEGDIGAVKETIRRLKEGHVLNIYPEGSRTQTGELGPIEPGIALMVRRAGVPVVPVVISGSFTAWPRGRKIFHPAPIRVLYGPPMELNHLKPAQITARIDQTFRQLLAELRAKS
ncbi:MAG: 1-acyl-sn-glycerol-3-phosphate acyltransferase [Phycisphaerales bacterium]|jgi:1-acyl-sn-glycerol-3-phosphate acyltransferase|nr:1-acyl-sn-glycerol-3-phosphate acyltransferase [Phycisphaerales bacterium]